MGKQGMDAFSPDAQTAVGIQSPDLFRALVNQALRAPGVMGSVRAVPPDGVEKLSVVLLLIGMDRPSPAGPAELCLILNKRSQRVRQPGDICCPGGGIEPRIDPIIARLLRLPASPLKRWPDYGEWQDERPEELHQIRLLLATALREGLEEMRLNPFTVRFLGGLPPEPLVMFRRVIQPLVVWVDHQRRFYPNWEVERVVRVSIQELLNPVRYICYRLTMPSGRAGGASGEHLDFPAFRFATPNGIEILWGATFRITMGFLNKVLNFVPPELETLDVVERELPLRYMNGGRRRS
jgi:hypothetical protein